jgi:hypothetical protein
MSAMNIRFDLPWVAVAAAILPLISAFVFRLWHRRRVKRLSQLGVEAAIERLAPQGVRRAPVARAVRVSLAIGLATLAFAGPRWGSGSNVEHSEASTSCSRWTRRFRCWRRTSARAALNA